MMKSVWHEGVKWRGGSILETEHGQILQKMVDDICHLETVDLGCGNRGAREIFSNYTGLDLPEWDVRSEGAFDGLRRYDIILMNAFLDVLPNPLQVLVEVLAESSYYVVIHRQEFTRSKTKIVKRKAYGGWTWHSIINIKDFLDVTRDFKILKMMNLRFDNWNFGGHSLLLEK